MTKSGGKMFLGEYNHNIDGKGRIIIPSKIRENLSETFVVTKGLDNCIFLYNIEDWEELTTKVKALPLTDASVRKFVRFFFGGASELSIDSQGRILLPTNLRDFANLKKEVVTVGVSNRAEIWAKDTFDKYSQDNEFDDDLAEKMASLGI
ncbi:MAG: division/cell wall cluster transcriptional repressor MraZ [Lachnospirales bacterium]